MDMERAAMRGKLAEAKERADQYRMKAEAICRSIRMDLNVNLTNLEDMNIPQANMMMDDLSMTWAEYIAAMGDIARLQRELA